MLKPKRPSSVVPPTYGFGLEFVDTWLMNMMQFFVALTPPENVTVQVSFVALGSASSLFESLHPQTKRIRRAMASWRVFPNLVSSGPQLNPGNIRNHRPAGGPGRADVERIDGAEI